MQSKCAPPAGFAATFCALLLPVFTAEGTNSSGADLSPRDRAIIEEAYNVWSSVADSIWPGASRVVPPMVYVGEHHEYAIGFGTELAGFTKTGPLGTSRYSVQMRPRTLAPDLEASFPFEGTPAVVIGRPEALGKSPDHWVVTASHEMFHVFQGAHRKDDKVATLGIGPRNDGSWHLTFPFPYSDADVMRLIHLQGYLLSLVFAAPDSGNASYNAGTALDAVHVYRSRLDQIRSDGKAYKYSQFQEWTEGVAAYTELKIAEAISKKGYRPTKAFSTLPTIRKYEDLWTEVYQHRVYLVKHAGRAAKSRTAFYHLGMGKALALDALNPAWKERYFAPGIWLDDLLVEAIAAWK